MSKDLIKSVINWLILFSIIGSIWNHKAMDYMFPKVFCTSMVLSVVVALKEAKDKQV